MFILFTILFSLSTLYADSGILPVSWPSSNPTEQKTSAPYPSVLTKGIQETKLPVYLPSIYAYDKKMIVIADENFYTITFLLDNAIVMIEGDKTYQESLSPTNPEFQSILTKSSNLEFIQSEGIMSSDFTRHGINYTIQIECEAQNVDNRCKEESFIRNLYNKLIMVGGKR